MSSFLYYLATAGESVLSVFGVRGTYEQPKYTVVGHVDPDVELRAYRQRVAAETTMRNGNDGEAFGRLFRYITGANQGGGKIAMTVPVEMKPPTGGEKIAMTVPVQVGAENTMRFFLPRSVVEKGPPAPTDPLVHIVTLPAQTFAVVRFSGTIDDATRDAQEKALLAALSAAGKHVEGTPSVLSYDPPFAVPFLRRNEVAVQVEDEKGS